MIPGALLWWSDGCDIISISLYHVNMTHIMRYQCFYDAILQPEFILDTSTLSWCATEREIT